MFPTRRRLEVELALLGHMRDRLGHSKRAIARMRAHADAREGPHNLAIITKRVERYRRNKGGPVHTRPGHINEKARAIGRAA